MAQFVGAGNTLNDGTSHALVDDGDTGTQPVTPNSVGGVASLTSLLVVPPQIPKAPRTGRQEKGEGEEDGDEGSDYEDYNYINCKGQPGNYLELQENALKPMFLAACEEVAVCEASIRDGCWRHVEEAQAEIKSGVVKSTPGAVAAVNTAFLLAQNMLALKADSDRFLAGRIVRGILDCLCDAPQKKARAEERRDRIQKARVSLPERMAKKRASRIRQECDDAKATAGCNLVIGKRQRK